MENTIDIRLLSMQDQKDAGCVDFDSIIRTIEEAFTHYHLGSVLLPDKISIIFNKEVQNRINCMPSAILDQGVCGIKWVSVFPDNPHRYGISNVSGIIILSETEKGYPFAVMDGTLITSLRTAAMGAIGAKYLARDTSTTYGTIGAGEQAKMHFRFIKHTVPSINTCFVSSRTSESENVFIEEMRKDYRDVTFIACNSNYDIAARDSDIIVSAVSCQKPLLKAECIKEGAYYCHVGGWEDEFFVPLKANKIVCDNWDALKHRGSPTIARMYSQGLLKDEDIYANIAEIIIGEKEGRTNDKEFIYFNSIGLSFVDVSVAYSFYNKATEKGLGQVWKM